ncbi:hypothetical protein [Roseateles sp. BYS180W]
MDPVLRIESVTDEQGRSLGTVTISDVTLAGTPVRGEVLSAGGTSITRNGDSLVCTLPCGLFTQPGKYGFTLGASGYVAQTFQVDAKYANFVGGCPSTSSGGTVFSARLSRSGA